MRGDSALPLSRILFGGFGGGGRLAPTIAPPPGVVEEDEWRVEEDHR
jgi:hypothetical protein